VQLHVTRASALQKFYRIKPFVMGRCRISENPVGLNEDMAHSFMSQFGAIGDPQRE
jgi:hypothetical protein